MTVKSSEEKGDFMLSVKKIQNTSKDRDKKESNIY